MEEAVSLPEEKGEDGLIFLQFLSYQFVWEVYNTKTMYGRTEQKTLKSLEILSCESLLLTD